MSMMYKIVLFIAFTFLWPVAVFFYSSRKKRLKEDSPLKDYGKKIDQPEKEDDDMDNEVIEGLSFELLYPEQNLTEKDYDKLSELAITFNSIIKGDYKVPEQFKKDAGEHGKQNLQAESSQNETLTIVHNKGYIENIDAFFREEKSTNTKKKNLNQIDNNTSKKNS